jgi:Abnormal spindle-like microcephaly-assoc'd, ASPM-SPD-2-Hydin
MSRHRQARVVAIAAVLAVAVCVGSACGIRNLPKVGDTSQRPPGRSGSTFSRGSGADRTERPARIVITPAEIDFGETRVGNETRKTITLTNGLDYAITVMQMTFDRACFLRSPSSSLPMTIQAQNDATLELTFRPLARGVCEGRLLIEVDSAVGRVRMASIRGLGI